MTKTPTATSMIARAVAKGQNETRANELLSAILIEHTGCNLAYALVWWGFANERQAQAFADAVAA